MKRDVRTTAIRLRSCDDTGQYFDIRLEVHAPVNGSEAFNSGNPDEKFKFCIQKGRGQCTDAAKFFSVPEPQLEKWSFRWVLRF